MDGDLNNETVVNEDGTEQIMSLAEKHEGLPIVLKGDESIATSATFRPPIAITIVAKTNSTNLRMAYAADQVIFNWEVDRTQLRVDGGPADGHHKMGAGGIPTNKYVVIRWEVTPDGQKIYVDGDLRFEDHSDYSKINNPIRIFPSHGSVVTVRSIRTKAI